MIGRPHVQAEVEKRLPGQVMSVSVGPSKDDIIGYLRVRINEDESSEAMDSGLVAEILEKIPDKMSEMYVEVMLLGDLPHYPLIYVHLDFYWSL